jgi:hypothetical protein
VSTQSTRLHINEVATRDGFQIEATSFTSPKAIPMLRDADKVMDYNTGIDEDKLLETARSLPTLLDHDIPSQLIKAGPRLNRVAATQTQQ